MNIRRTLASAAAVALVLTALTACLGLPGLPGLPGAGGGTTQADLDGTAWGGTDSDGDVWGVVFQSDGTIGLTYNGNEYDDPTDTWVLDGSDLTISVAFNDGDVTMVGDYDGGDSIDLDASFTGGDFTLTLERE